MQAKKTKNPCPICGQYHSPAGKNPKHAQQQQQQLKNVFVSVPRKKKLLQGIDQFPGKWYPILDQNSLTSISYPRLNCLKTISLTAAYML